MRGAQLKGWSRQNLLLEAGIREPIDFSSKPRLTPYQMTRLSKTIWRVLEDEFMGFTKSPSKPGTFAFAVSSMRKEPNLRAALLTGLQFYSLVTEDIVTTLVEEDNNAVIDIHFAFPDLDLDHYFEEFWMVIWHRLASWLTGIRIPLKSISFSQDNPAYKEELGYMFPGIQSYGAETSQLHFDSRYLALPIIRSSSEVDSFLGRSPYQLMSIPGSDGTLYGSIMSLLQPENDEPLSFPSLNEVAKQLGMAEGTLRRRLLEESSNYSQIKTELRRNLAYKLLSEGDTSIGDIADAVGFTESSSFIRAFKDWSGITPLQYKQRISKSSGGTC